MQNDKQTETTNCSLLHSKTPRVQNLSEKNKTHAMLSNIKKNGKPTLLRTFT